MLLTSTYTSLQEKTTLPTYSPRHLVPRTYGISFPSSSNKLDSVVRLGSVLKPTMAGPVFRTLTGTARCLENSFLCLTYIVETLVVRDGTRLALATYYDTLYVFILFDIRDSGGFLTFHSVLSFSVSMTFGRLFLYKRLYCSGFSSSSLSFISSSSSFDL